MRLIPGDAVRLLPRFRAESVDLIVTDPPYPTISGGNTTSHRRCSGMLSANDGRIFRHNDVAPTDWLPQAFRILRDPGHCYIFTNFLNLESMMAAARAAGFELHNLLIWRKQNATPNRWYMKNIEYVILARKGAARRITDAGSMTCHDFENPVGRKSHPTEKPVDLLRFYIENSSGMGQLVLDPFAGTGSTLVAARSCGRVGLGIEIDPEYLATASRRLGVMPG